MGKPPLLRGARDGRGPKGIWTLRRKKLPITGDYVPFEFAKPSFTHQVGNWGKGRSAWGARTGGVGGGGGCRPAGPQGASYATCGIVRMGLR